MACVQSVQRDEAGRDERRDSMAVVPPVRSVVTKREN